MCQSTAQLVALIPGNSQLVPTSRSRLAFFPLLHILARVSVGCLRASPEKFTLRLGL